MKSKQTVPLRRASIFSSDFLSSAQVLLALVLFGGLVGMAHSQWIVGVENAQAILGWIKADAGNSSYIYNTSVYSFWLIQMPAILLRFGMSEWTVCLLMSVLQGMLLFAALGAGAMVFCRHWLAGLLGAVFVEQMGRLRFLTEHHYPILWPVTFHIFGAVGLSASLLCLCLLSLGYARCGLLLLGMLPSVHPTLGALTIGLAAIGAWFEQKAKRQEFLRAMKWMAPGFALFFVSASLQFLYLRKVPSGIDMTEAWQLLLRFVDNGWSWHMQPLEPSLLLVDTLLVFVALSMTSEVRRVSQGHSRFLMVPLILAAVSISVYVLLLHLFAPLIPYPFKALLLPRLLNLCSIVFPLLLFGLLFHRGIVERRWISTVFLFGLAAIVFPPSPLSGVSWLAACKALFFADFAKASRVILAPVPSLIAVLYWVVWKLGKDELRYGQTGERVAYVLTAGLLLGGMGMSFRGSSSHWLTGQDNDQAFFEIVKKGTGQVLAAPLMERATQLRSRRAVVAGGLDEITYAPAGAVRMEKVMKTVFGVSLHDPDGPKRFYSDEVKNLWERRTPSEWAEIGKTFEVTDVMVPAGWKLNLAEVARSPSRVLYHLP